MNTKPILRTLVRERKISALDRLQNLFESLSISEKAAFLVAALVLLGAVFSLASKVSARYSVGVARHGGSLVEGVVGTPRFVNPLLAVSDADRDLTALVYSGLIKARPDGSFVPDLAEEFTVSPDGLVYSVTIREDAAFHDGTPVTADDVVFTIEKAQDAALKSPRRVSWDGVTVKKTADRALTFTLKQPYAPFMSSLTMGILPSRLWKSLDADQIPFSALNIAPVGSGPYEIESTRRGADGIPTEATLRANESYALGQPYIETIHLKFYMNETDLATALERGDVESASNLSPAIAESLKDARLVTAPFTRVFGIFFNQNQNEALLYKEARRALSAAIDREAIIDEVLSGYGTVADGPLPPSVVRMALEEGAEAEDGATQTAAATSTSQADAEAILAKAGWKKGPEGVYEVRPRGKTATTSLTLSLSTANIPELVGTAKQIEDAWRNLGAQVDVRVFEPADLNQGVIRPRTYDALLFGIVTGKNADLYPFWHSSQRNDPGLNISLYANSKADRLLERMRQATSTAAARTLYAQLKTEIDADTPAAFLWSPDFIYAVPDRLKGVELGEITTPSDRFLGVEKWYIDTDRVWHVFVGDKDSVINN